MDRLYFPGIENNGAYVGKDTGVASQAHSQRVGDEHGNTVSEIVNPVQETIDVENEEQKSSDQEKKRSSHLAGDAFFVKKYHCSADGGQENDTLGHGQEYTCHY